ncbi:MAG: DUF2313 domain-containing protein [Lachnospiraceae bacterium]|nr:DUF2313 domain-containing protein [Lachnospiraceae bacterium]
MSYIKFIPLEMRDITEYQELGVASDPEFIKATNKREQVLNNHYMSELNEEGCSRLETIIGITDGSSKPVEQRRITILARANNELPYTIYNLKPKLRNLLKNDGFDLVMDYANYHLTIILFIYNSEKFALIKQSIEDEIPCNIRLTVSLQYNSYDFFKRYTYNELKQWTYKYMKEHYFEGA